LPFMRCRNAYKYGTHSFQSKTGRHSLTALSRTSQNSILLNFGVLSFWKKKNDQVCSFFVMLFLCTESFSFRVRSCFCETSCSWILLCGVYSGNFILILKKTLFSILFWKLINIFFLFNRWKLNQTVLTWCS